MAAGLAQLKTLRDHPRIYAKLSELGERLERGLRGLPGLHVNRVGSMLTLFFRRGPVTDFAAAARSDKRRFAKFHRAMLKSGIYLPPSQFEAWFLSAAHTRRDVDRAIRAAKNACRS